MISESAKMNTSRESGVFICQRTAIVNRTSESLDKIMAKVNYSFLFGDNMKVSMALYGNVSIERGYCKECEGNSFIKDGKFACCGALVDVVPGKFERMSEPSFQRKTPTKAEKSRILNEQENRCFYCGVQFDTYRYRNGLPFLVKINWDHKMPFSYSQNNKTANFVAACHVCNGIKSNTLFQTVEEAQTHIAYKRKSKGYDF
jgi:5-methylcytosine-specific restriction endonuclease McrA